MLASLLIIVLIAMGGFTAVIFTVTGQESHNTQIAATKAAARVAKSITGAIIVETQHGCIRGQSDRRANRNSWYAAYQRATDSAKLESGAKAQVDRRAARTYLASARSLNSRLTKKESLRLHGRYPLGKGHLDCERAFSSSGYKIIAAAKAHGPKT